MNLFDIWGNKDKLAIIDSFITLRNQKYLTLCFHNGDVLRNIEYSWHSRIKRPFLRPTSINELLKAVRCLCVRLVDVSLSYILRSCLNKFT